MNSALDRQSPDAIRTLFSSAMSRMYQAEVPQYGTLVDLVAEVNAATLAADPELERRLAATGERERLGLERHGAIRLGVAAELAVMRRLFAVMGMAPVGYYDLSPAGVPVHSTAFRPVEEAALHRNPFRVFTSLLRLELIEDVELRRTAADILAHRSIFTPGCLEMIELAEREGGLTEPQARLFVSEALETFRWHAEATVSDDVYQRLRRAHPLVADVVCFKGPHINHLTPRTLDIDRAQDLMSARGLKAKAVIEGPPCRATPILLRQTSFKALEERIAFLPRPDETVIGAHTARFGEIEQRGVALTPKGFALYDRLLAEARAEAPVAGEGASAEAYRLVLERRFEAFPDCEADLRREGLAYFRYVSVGGEAVPPDADIEMLVADGAVTAEPITYEDFLPVSAAGIFQSNLGDDGRQSFEKSPNKAAFEQAMDAQTIDPFTLYLATETQSKLRLRGPGSRL